MKKYVILLICVVLTGCFASTKNSAFYLMEAQKTQNTVSDAKFNIAVQDIVLPDYLKRPQIVLQEQDSPKLMISEFHRWGSDLGQMIQNTLLEDLQNVMPNAFVKPLMYGESTQYIVQVNLEKLSGDFNENAVLRGDYKIVSATGKTIREKTFHLITPAGKNYVSYVEAQSKLIGDLATNIALEIKDIRARK